MKMHKYAEGQARGLAFRGRAPRKELYFSPASAIFYSKFSQRKKLKIFPKKG